MSIFCIHRDAFVSYGSQVIGTTDNGKVTLTEMWSNFECVKCHRPKREDYWVQERTTGFSGVTQYPAVRIDDERSSN